MTRITDEMIERAHNVLRGTGWHGLHSATESGQHHLDAIRAALDAALNGQDNDGAYEPATSEYGWRPWG